MADSIYNVAERIKTKQDFLDFLVLLKASREDVPEDWENETLAAYLDGLYGYVGDTPDEKGDGEGLSWRRLADILLAARVYE